MRIIAITIATMLLGGAAAAQGPISLEEYRAAVVQKSFSLERSQYSSQAALELRLKARKGFLPQLSATGDFTYNLRSQPIAAGTASSHMLTLQPQIVEVLYGGGSVRNAYSQAKSSYRIVQFTQQYTLLEMLYAADYIYWNVAAAAEQYATAKHYVAIVQSLQEVVQERFNNGYISKSDLLMVSSRLAEAQFAMIQAESGYRQARMNFNTLRATELSTPVDLAGQILQDVDTPSTAHSSMALERRPDLMAAQENIIRSRFATRLSASAYNPHLSIGVLGAWNGLRPTSWRINDATAIGFAKLSIPIFSWGERRNSVRAARASEQIAQVDRVELEQNIILEVEQARESIAQSSAQVIVAQQALKIASESLELNSFSYSEGKLTILDVLSAQLSWIQSYTNTISANLGKRLAIAQYNKAMANSPTAQ